MRLFFNMNEYMSTVEYSVDKGKTWGSVNNLFMSTEMNDDSHFVLAIRHLMYLTEKGSKSYDGRNNPTFDEKYSVPYQLAKTNFPQMIQEIKRLLFSRNPPNENTRKSDVLYKEYSKTPNRTFDPVRLNITTDTFRHEWYSAYKRLSFRVSNEYFGGLVA